jgi:hypothetical protein
MATKHTSTRAREGAGDDEPIFVLRANDALAETPCATGPPTRSTRACRPAKVQARSRSPTQMNAWPHKKIPD